MYFVTWHCPQNQWYLCSIRSNSCQSCHSFQCILVKMFRKLRVLGQILVHLIILDHAGHTRVVGLSWIYSIISVYFHAYITFSLLVGIFSLFCCLFFWFSADSEFVLVWYISESLLRPERGLIVLSKWMYALPVFSNLHHYYISNSQWSLIMLLPNLLLLCENCFYYITMQRLMFCIF